jgi:REase_DpnII-MboI
MEWAQFGVDYLRKARNSAHEEFNEVMNEVRQHARAREESWYAACKSIMQALYHYSDEFPGDGTIPNERFSSPIAFEQGLLENKAFLDQMLKDLDLEEAKYRAENDGADGSPFLVTAVKGRVAYMREAVEYVASRKPSDAVTAGPAHDLPTILGLAVRFHEPVLALRKHPHGGQIFAVKDEWDCQYLFRSILAVYFPDVRTEEWNPSVAGSASRCEFFLKDAGIMVELKYVRRADDQKKIKTELLTGFEDYAANPQVTRVVALIYDPDHHLPSPVQLQKDLSGPRKGLEDVRVIVSPPRHQIATSGTQ